MKVTTCSFQHGLKLIYSFVFLSSKIVFFDRRLHLTQSTCTGVILLWVSIVFKLRIYQSRKGLYIVVDPDPNSSLYTKRKLAKQNDTAGKNYVLPTCSSSSAIALSSEQMVSFPNHGWGNRLEKMPLFTKAEMNRFIEKREVRHANFEGTAVMSIPIFFPPRPFLISLSRKCGEETFVISVSLNFVPMSLRIFCSH